MAVIKCTAEDCTYWESGNNCSAEQILVMASSSEMQNADKMGHNAERLQTAAAGEEQGTFCHTFSKQSGLRM